MTGQGYGQNDPTRGGWQPPQDPYPPPGAPYQWSNQPMFTPPPPARSRTGLWLVVGVLLGVVVGVLGALLTVALWSADPPAVISRDSRPAAEIPDDDAVGITDRITLTEGGTVGVLGLTVSITHPVPSDLSVELVSPSGRRVAVVEPSRTNVNAVEGSAWSAPLVGDTIPGDWQLVVVDSVGIDVGTLNSWRLDVTPAAS